MTCKCWGSPQDTPKPSPLPVQIPDLPTEKRRGNMWTERLMMAGSFQFSTEQYEIMKLNVRI